MAHWVSSFQLLLPEHTLLIILKFSFMSLHKTSVISWSCLYLQSILLFLTGKKICSALYRDSDFTFSNKTLHWGRSRKNIYTYRVITYTIILHLEIECLLQKSCITKDFETSHPLLVNFINTLPKSVESPSNEQRKQASSHIILLYQNLKSYDF